MPQSNMEIPRAAAFCHFYSIIKVQTILNDWIKSLLALSQDGRQRLKKKLLTQFSIGEAVGAVGIMSIATGAASRVGM